MQAAPQPLPPVAIRLQVEGAPKDLQLVLNQRARKQPTVEIARCGGQCDIAITPGSYRLEVGDSKDTRAGDLSLYIDRPGTYTVRPASRDTLVPGAVLATIGPGLMGMGAGLAIAHSGDNEDNPGGFWAGAGLFALGTLATGGGWALYANRPRVTFSEQAPRSANAVQPTVQPDQQQYRYRDDQPVPPGYRVRREPLRGLMTAGILTFSIPYGLAAAFGAAGVAEDGTDSDLAPLLIPVVGPLLVSDDSSNDGGDRAGLALIVALPQAAGLTMLIVGASSEKQTLVPVSNISLTPVVAPHAAGFVVGGEL